MKLQEARVVLRDRNVLDVVDLAFRFVTRHTSAYAWLAVPVLPPAFVVSWWVARASGSWGLAWGCALVLAPFVGAPFTVLASRLMFAPRARVVEVLRTTGGALPRLLVLRAFEAVALTLGAILFVLPAAWFLALFSFIDEVIVLERATVPGSVARLQRLFAGASGTALLAVLFLLALHIVAVFAGDLAGRALLADLLEITPPPSIVEARGSALGLIGFWAFVPFAATCRFLLYVNVRTRTEGWDVQTRFAAIAARAGSPP